MEKEPRNPELALKDLASLDSLDTARMALRWALERIHALEARLEGQEKTLEAQAAREVELRETAVRLAARERRLEADRRALEEREKEGLEDQADAVTRAEARAREAARRELTASEAAWHDERRLLLSELSNLRARGREYASELMSAKSLADEFRLECERLRADLRAAQDARDRGLADLEEQRRARSVESSLRETAEASAAAVEARVEELKARLDIEHRRAEAAEKALGDELAARAEESRRLVELERTLTGRLGDAERAALSRREAWLASEEEARLKGEAREREIEEERARVSELRRALIDAIARYKGGSKP